MSNGYSRPMSQAAQEVNRETISDYVRIEETDEGYRLSARDEIGRGKRFGTAGKIDLSPNEAAEIVRWLIVNLDERAFEQE